MWKRKTTNTEPSENQAFFSGAFKVLCSFIWFWFVFCSYLSLTIQWTLTNFENGPYFSHKGSMPSFVNQGVSVMPSLRTQGTCIQTFPLLPWIPAGHLSLLWTGEERLTTCQQKGMSYNSIFFYPEFNRLVAFIMYLGNIRRGSFPEDSLSSLICNLPGTSWSQWFPPDLVFDLRCHLGDKDQLCNEARVKFSLLYTTVYLVLIQNCVPL